MHGRVQGFDPAAEHFGEACHGRNIAHGQARLGQCAGRAAAGHQFPIHTGQCSAETKQAHFVVHRKYRSRFYHGHVFYSW